MSNDVWALAELSHGKLASISLQLASKAAELAVAFGGESAALAFGVNSAAAAQELGACGVKTVYASEGAVYDQYLVQPHADHRGVICRQRTFGKQRDLTFGAFVEDLDRLAPGELLTIVDLAQVQDLTLHYLAIQ